MGYTFSLGGCCTLHLLLLLLGVCDCTSALDDTIDSVLHETVPAADGPVVPLVALAASLLTGSVGGLSPTELRDICQQFADQDEAGDAIVLLEPNASVFICIPMLPATGFTAVFLDANIAVLTGWP